MKERLHSYLLGERKAGRAYLLFAVAATAAGILLLLTVPGPFWQGVSTAVLAIALIEYWAGWQFLSRYRRLRGRLPDLLENRPTRYRDEELQRCEALEQRYARQRSVVILFIVLGISLALLGGVVHPRPLTMGMGYGLCLQGAVLLVLDLAAQWRNGIYYQQVDHFNPNP